MQKGRSSSIIVRTALAVTCGPISVGKLATVLLTLLIYHSTFTAKADSCPSVKDEIDTDRPDVTNSSVVVPGGSLQIENGLNISTRDKQSICGRHKYAAARRHCKLSRVSCGRADL